MEIQWVGMTRRHYEAGDSKRIRMVVIHATAGRAPGDYNWLRNGGNEQRPVSIHYYISKVGVVSQLVKDADIAWHCGQSQWQVDGKRVTNCNSVAVGIELENHNDGRDLYSQPQYDALLGLTQQLVRTYKVPRSQLVRHLDIAPGRKSDPAGFPWERFVAAVYADQAAETLPPTVQVRDLLLDLAYRAARGGMPARWSLRREAELQAAGMPIYVISRPERDKLPQGESQDDQIRPVTIAGNPLVLEAYARDLFYAPPDNLEAVSRLSTTPTGPLRDALLEALFRTADPQQGFKPTWAFHIFYLANMSALGVPISANQRLKATTSDGQAYACQHFALDTLCSPADRWGQIFRLSELVAAQPTGDAATLSSSIRGELAQILRNDLYQQRTSHAYSDQGLFCQYAHAQHLGAPIGPPDYELTATERLVMMPFALDTIYCRLPAEPSAATDGQIMQNEAVVGRLSTLLAGNPELPTATFAGPFLGAPQPDQRRIETTTLGMIATSVETTPELLLIYPTDGPAQQDIQAALLNTTPPWHYYLDHRGQVTTLREESGVVLPLAAGRRVLSVAVEGTAGTLAPTQARALAVLVRDLMTRHQLSLAQVKSVKRN